MSKRGPKKRTPKADKGNMSPLPIPPSMKSQTYAGVFREYLTKNLSEAQIEKERRKYLVEIGRILECEVITYAARMTPMTPWVDPSINYGDLLPFVDILDSIHGDRVAVVLETHGGAGEIGRQMVEMLHERFDHVIFIIPGTAKSTGTIMALGGHEIIMGPESSLGPIDAQLVQAGKQFSADAFIEGLNRLKKEVEASGKLNQAYIPLLQRISPGEIEHAHNALEFARATVREWLVKYKFGKWETHSTTGAPVTEQEKVDRAREISARMTSQKIWHTHARSIRIPELVKLGLIIRDMSKEPQLYNAVRRYNVLMRITLEKPTPQGNAYKLIESRHAGVVFRFNQPIIDQPDGSGIVVPPFDQIDKADIEAPCPNCRQKVIAQLNLKPGLKLQPGRIQYPENDIAVCPNCGANVNFKSGRQQLNKILGSSRPNQTQRK